MTRPSQEAAVGATAPTAPRSRRGRRGSEFFWLAAAISFTAFLGFGFTYFGPLFRGEYPEVSPAVHLHGWTFFAWYLLLPVQAGLVRLRRLSVHRTLGMASVVLAALMVGTGLLVLGTQLRLSLQPGGDPFWLFLGLAILASLLLFAGFYVAALRARRRGPDHKRYIVLASAGGLGAATFRIFGTAFGFGTASQVAGVLAPNLFVIAAIAVDLWRGRGWHPVYRVGLPVSVLATVGALLVTPTPVGRLLHAGLAWIGQVMAPLY